jgi:hypothetical protein
MVVKILMYNKENCDFGTKWNCFQWSLRDTDISHTVKKFSEIDTKMEKKFIHYINIIIIGIQPCAGLGRDQSLFRRLV